MQLNLKVETTTTTAFGLDDFLRVFHSESSKEMRDTRQVSHDGTTEVTKARMNTLTHEIEFF